MTFSFISLLAVKNACFTFNFDISDLITAKNKVKFFSQN